MAYYNRKNPRIPHYDYSSNNYYFVTICTHDMACIFWDAWQLNVLGTIARDLLLEIPRHVPGTAIDQCVVMPNHVHAIVVIDAPEFQQMPSLSRIIAAYKAAVSREIHQLHPNLKVWQRSFHDHIIRDQRSYEKIWTYIQGNPAQWLEDCFHPQWDES